MCAFAPNLAFMIVFRILQGLGGGGLAPTEQSIFADSFTPEKRAGAFALYGVTVVVAPAVGPLLGGWLTDSYSWHWIFLINLPVGALALALIWFLVDEPKAVVEDTKKFRAEVHPRLARLRPRGADLRLPADRARPLPAGRRLRLARHRAVRDGVRVLRGRARLVGAAASAAGVRRAPLQDALVRDRLPADVPARRSRSTARPS